MPACQDGGRSMMGCPDDCTDGTSSIWVRLVRRGWRVSVRSRRRLVVTLLLTLPANVTHLL